jgi:hypothetical protein
MDLNGKASTTIAVISITPEMFAIHDEYPSGATESRHFKLNFADRVQSRASN